MKYLYIICVLLCVYSCREEEPTAKPHTLKAAFANSFIMGVAVNKAQYTSKEIDATNIVLKHFNSITAENSMKWQYISPQQSVFDFADADAFVNFGIENNLKVIGHTLLWHSQLPEWVHAITDSAELRNIMYTHIDSVAGRYKGTIHGWDVVNEAFHNDGSFRDTVFYKYMGQAFIEEAFARAHSVDSSAELYYNDYNMTFEGKRNAVVDMIHNLKNKNIRIDAVGMQGHWNLEHPSLEDIETSIIAYTNAGVDVMITELDISVLPRDENPYEQELPEHIENKLSERYKSLFQLFYKHRNKISRVTVWGVHDGQSWLNNHPTEGRTDYPLLFDRNYEAKNCVYAILNIF
ncbi:MAG: endo-1,4-beta-xylanase [Bacteroidales bacterium]|jgi:endo-1,4-beta-xylanase|nr:endo-1,4-beta-xylanase [Bacteroidales bacterium]